MPIHQEVTKKDFKVFYREDAPNTSQVRTSEMGFEEKTPNLLVSLTAYVGGSSVAVAAPPHPQMPATARTQPIDATYRKRK